MDQFLQIIENNSNLSILIACVVVLISIIIVWLAKQSSSKNKTILITGLSNSGKTTLYSQLVFKKILLTQTSIVPNSKNNVLFEKTTTTKEKRLDLIDIPGNDKVRRRFFNLCKKTVKAVIFVVDSSTYQQNQKDVAQYFYEILTDEHLSKSSNTRILVVCNKQDIDFAKGETLIQTSLEKEIELLKKMSSSALKSTNDSKQASGNKLQLTTSDEVSFEFKNLKYLKVDFAEATCTDESSIKKTITNWVQTKI